MTTENLDTLTESFNQLRADYAAALATIASQNTTIAGLQANGNGTVPGAVYDEAVAQRDAALAKLAAIDEVQHPATPAE